MSRKPTPGLEPGTPSLRVKRVQLADPAISLQTGMSFETPKSVEVERSPQRSSDVFQRCSNRPSGMRRSRKPLEVTGLSRVRIPPLRSTKRFLLKEPLPRNVLAVLQTATLSPRKSVDVYRSPLAWRTTGAQMPPSFAPHTARRRGPGRSPYSGVAMLVRVLAGHWFLHHAEHR
jgi:hypothetical protein